MATKTHLDLPFRQAAGDGGRRSLTQLLVIHATDNPGADNPKTQIDEAAENEAGYATHRHDRISAHAVIDDDSAIQTLLLDHVAYGCYPTGNSRSIQLELAGRSGHLSPATITRAANLSAIICHLWALPIRKVVPADMRRGVKGICGHVDVTTSWHTGRDHGADHTDPGSNFPWTSFIGQIRQITAKLYAPHAPAIVHPAAPHLVVPAPAIPRPAAPAAPAVAHPAVPHSVPLPTAPTYDTITTIVGDRLDLLARTFYGDPAKAEQIKADNHLVSDTLTPGQKLRIRQPHKPVYRVAPGDTAWGVAKKGHLLLSVLTTLNQHRVPDMSKLPVGIWLRTA